MSDQFKVNGVQYRQRYNECNKLIDCKCHSGEKHGPYWYSYDGSSAAKYVGKKLPEHVTARVALLKANREKFRVLKAKITKQRDDAYQEYRRHDRELAALRNLETGEYAASEILKSLGLSQFNGHAKE